MESKTLQEINESYIKEIFQFFCFEYYRMNIHKIEQDKVINDISENLDNQINKRLSNILQDWKLDIFVEEYTLSEKRDNVLSSILEDNKINYPPLNFKLYYQLNKGTDIKILNVITKL
jgi:hypothetical protein